MLQFDWDEENIEHIAQHAVTAVEVEQALGNPTIDIEYQDWHDEERFAEVGITDLGRILVVITTWRGLLIRVVTAYDAPKDVALEYLRIR